MDLSRAYGLSSVYFPGAASVIAAKKKWEKYRFLINHDNKKLNLLLLRYKGDTGTVHDRFLRDYFQRIPLFLIEYHVIVGQAEYLWLVLELQLVA